MDVDTSFDFEQALEKEEKKAAQQASAASGSMSKHGSIAAPACN